MDITRRSDYACRILRALCTHEGQFRSVAEIAQEEDIPYSFARSIQHDLVKAGLLRTERGVRGGVTMAVDCADVTLLDVMKVVQGKVGIAPCSQDPQYCQKAASCAYHGIWCEADKMLAGYFASITLADLFRSMNGGVECSQVVAAGSAREPQNDAEVAGEGDAVA